MNLLDTSGPQSPDVETIAEDKSVKTAAPGIAPVPSAKKPRPAAKSVKKAAPSKKEAAKPAKTTSTAKNDGLKTTTLKKGDKLIYTGGSRAGTWLKAGTVGEFVKARGGGKRARVKFGDRTTTLSGKHLKRK